MRKLILLLFILPLTAAAKTPTILTNADGGKYIEVLHAGIMEDIKDAYGVTVNETDTIRVPLNQDGSDVLIANVIPFDGISADDLYFKVKLAASDFWRNVEDASVLDDDKNRVLICKTRTKWSNNPDARLMHSVLWVEFTTKIECRDNRLRVSMYNFRTVLSEYKLEYDFASIFKYGVNNKGFERSGIGRSFRAWMDVASHTQISLIGLINSGGADAGGDDW